VLASPDLGSLTRTRPHKPLLPCPRSRPISFDSACSPIPYVGYPSSLDRRGSRYLPSSSTLSLRCVGLRNPTKLQPSQLLPRPEGTSSPSIPSPSTLSTSCKLYQHLYHLIRCWASPDLPPLPPSSPVRPSPSNTPKLPLSSPKLQLLQVLPQCSSSSPLLTAFMC
jgi:hypothetical protein